MNGYLMRRVHFQTMGIFPKIEQAAFSEYVQIFVLYFAVLFG